MTESRACDLTDMGVPDVVEIERLVAGVRQRVAEPQHRALVDDGRGVGAARVGAIVDHHRHLDQEGRGLGDHIEIGVDWQRGDGQRVVGA